MKLREPYPAQLSAHDVLRQLENGLRRFIIEKVEAHDKNYWTNRIPQDLREQAERRISELAIVAGIAAVMDLIACML